MVIGEIKVEKGSFFIINVANFVEECRLYYYIPRLWNTKYGQITSLITIDDTVCIRISRKVPILKMRNMLKKIRTFTRK